MSIKKNFAYSSILTVSGYLFPLLTFPYVSRVLGVTNIGICNYIDSIITYFCVFSAMGISVVGVREIARVSDSIVERSNTFINILLINSGFTLFSIVALLICIFSISDFFQYRTLFYIGILKLLSNLFLVEWFYKGLEDFGYITKRAIIVKVLYVLSVFALVKVQDDYIIYFFLTIFHISVNAFINIIHIRKSIIFRNIHIRIAPYIKSYIIMGVYMILTTMYTTFNIAILGYISGPTEVGYFTTATKVFSIILALFTAFTGVMLPRMSSLLANHEEKRFLSLIDKSMNALFIFAFPTVAFFVVFSPDVIYLIGGKGYEGAIMPFRIIMPLLFIVGYEQILIIQALMPMKKDKAIFTNSCIGATVGLLLNLILIPVWGSIGTSIAYFLCELSVLCSALFFMRLYTNYRIPYREFLYQLMSNVPLFIICILIYKNCEMNYIFKLLLTGAIVGMYTFVNNYYFVKNELFITLIDNINSKVWKTRK